MMTLPEKIDSKFRFVLLAAQRAERLIEAARRRPELQEKKPVLTAMREIGDDQVEWDYGPPPEEEAGVDSGPDA